MTGPAADPDGVDARGRTADERAAYRRFVREHHPDRGGDQDAFVDGLTRLSGPPTDPDRSRYDGPVEIVPDRARMFRTLRRYWQRVLRRPRRVV